MIVTIHRLGDPGATPDPVTGEYPPGAPTSHTEEALRVWPTAGREVSVGQQTHIAQAQAMLNANADVEMTDELEAFGVRYNVISVLPVPNIWETGVDHVRVDLSLVE